MSESAILRPMSSTPEQAIEDALSAIAERARPRIGVKLCKRPDCGEWFAYGPGTKHRETAVYCSPKCQKAHAYERRPTLA